MNRASSAIGWVRNPVMKSPDLEPKLASSYALGWTSNPITGCLNHINGMCKGGNFPCYAHRLAKGRLRKRYLANKNTATDYYDEDSYPFYPRFWPERIMELKKRKEHEWGRGRIVKHSQYPKGIFVCDMGELFGDWIPREWQDAIFRVIRHNPQHRFYLLTKQPQNLIKFSPFPDNCWVGVTATNDDMFTRAIYHLGNVRAEVKYISIEPLLSAIKLNGWYQFNNKNLQWLIIGAQTKPYRPPKVEDIEEIVMAADKAGIPVFLKDTLKPLLSTRFNGEDVIESHNLWAFKYFQLRQEMPLEGMPLDMGNRVAANNPPGRS